MTDKFWRRTDEWYEYANCFGVEDFTLPPQRDDSGPVADPIAVQAFCLECRVRPECARTAHDEQWNDVWVCGRWIPGHDTDRREANIVRLELLKSVPNELEQRGDDV